MVLCSLYAFVCETLNGAWQCAVWWQAWCSNMDMQIEDWRLKCPFKDEDWRCYSHQRDIFCRLSSHHSTWNLTRSILTFINVFILDTLTPFVISNCDASTWTTGTVWRSYGTNHKSQITNPHLNTAEHVFNVECSAQLQTAKQHTCAHQRSLTHSFAHASPLLTATVANAVYCYALYTYY